MVWGQETSFQWKPGGKAQENFDLVWFGAKGLRFRWFGPGGIRSCRKSISSHQLLVFVPVIPCQEPRCRGQGSNGMGAVVVTGVPRSNDLGRAHREGSTPSVHRVDALCWIFPRQPPASLPAARGNAKPWGRTSANIPSPSAITGSLWRAGGVTWLFHGHGITQGKARDTRERSWVLGLRGNLWFCLYPATRPPRTCQCWAFWPS